MKDHPARVPRWPYLLVRGTSTSLGVLAVAQAVFAGSFLDGRYDMLAVHATTAAAMVAVAVVQAVTVVFLYRAGGPRRIMLAGLLIPLILAGQAGLGMARVVSLHVPLGVLMVVGLLRLAAWAWRMPLPARAAHPVGAVPDDRRVGALS